MAPRTGRGSARAARRVHRRTAGLLELDVGRSLLASCGTLDGRYASFDSGDGQRFENGELGLVELRNLAAKNGEPEQRSGKQELLENLVNDAIARGC